MWTEHLIPLGLALCAFCGNVFESFRGIIVHQKKCKGTLNYTQGGFPKKCLSWWASEKRWYEGVATPSKLHPGCFEVVYSKKLYGKESMYVEPFHSLTFSALCAKSRDKDEDSSPCPVIISDDVIIDPATHRLRVLWEISV